MIQVGVIGASGYAGAELIRLLLQHPEAEVAAVGSSEKTDGRCLSEFYPGFRGIFDPVFVPSAEVIDRSDVVFAAVPHGVSEPFARQTRDAGRVFIDFGADFRLTSEEEYSRWYGRAFTEKDLHEEAVYGLPELNREAIRQAKLIANPGCYPTATALGLFPALRLGLAKTAPIIVDAKSGVTGAGAALTKDTHYPERNEGFHAYKVGAHRHTPEIQQTLTQMAGEPVAVTFTPHLLPANRGILATCYLPMNNVPLAEIRRAYADFYKAEPMVGVLPGGATADIKDVRYSNRCLIALDEDPRTGLLIVTSVIDNMIKGAAGQAIQNMNLVFGLPETMGLPLAAPAF